MCRAHQIIGGGIALGVMVLVACGVQKPGEPLRGVVATEESGSPEQRENHLQAWAETIKEPSGGDPSPVSLLSWYVRDKGKHLIRFRLTNLSSSSIRLWPFQLPWGNPNSIDLFSIDTDGTQVPVGSPIADPPEEVPILIEAGKTVQGDFDLESRIVSLPAALHRSDIIVVWSYRLTTAADDREEYRPNNGAIVVPKKP